METENKVEKEEETPQRQVITNRLQALRDELELRLTEAVSIKRSRNGPEDGEREDRKDEPTG